MRTTPDARTLGAAAQQLLRRQVVQAVRGGMRQTAAARTFGASLRAVSNGVRFDRTGGLRALRLKRRGRRAGERLLNEKQAAHIRGLIVGQMPDQLIEILTAEKNRLRLTARTLQKRVQAHITWLETELAHLNTDLTTTMR